MLDTLTVHIILDLCFMVIAGHGARHTFWKRNSTENIDLEIGFTLTNSNIGKCSLHCENITDCGSFSVDIDTSTCTGYLTHDGQSMTSFTKTQWYFSRNFDNPGQSAGQTYAFVDHNFTNCDSTGATGPSLASCRALYNKPWAMDLNNFNITSSGVQQWKVPETGLYRIQAYGAAGGYSDTVLGTNSGSHLAGGKGAMMQGSFTLSSGTLLNIVCGQLGSNGSWSEPGGGGGGTFVYTGSIGGDGLLIAAGGGGGAGEESTRVGYDGQSSEQSFGGSGFVGSELAANGGKGYGGTGGSVVAAAAGWKSDGASMTSSLNANPGSRWVGGSQVEVSYNPSPLISGAGGFGGGASGCTSNGGGSGGGYTGGAGSTTTTNSLRGGSGGGSYNSGSDQNNVAGYNNGHGYVYIQKV